MLVITRRPGQQLLIGEDVTVTVLEVSGASVRIGIEAPSDVRIFRHELWLEVKHENQAAAATPPDRLRLTTQEEITEQCL